jgi:splicing factor 45
MASQQSQSQSQKAPGLPNPYGIKKGLPNPYASATISGAPVRYNPEEQAKAEQQKKAPGIYLNCSAPLP